MTVLQKVQTGSLSLANFITLIAIAGPYLYQLECGDNGPCYLSHDNLCSQEPCSLCQSKAFSWMEVHWTPLLQTLLVSGGKAGFHPTVSYPPYIGTYGCLHSLSAAAKTTAASLPQTHRVEGISTVMITGSGTVHI